MVSKQKLVFDSLCEGELSFEEASKILNLSVSAIENLLDDFSWLPSNEYIRQNYPEKFESDLK